MPFSEKFPKLIVRRIFTTKLNPPEPMEAKIIDPNSVGVILRMVNKGLHSQTRRITSLFLCLGSRDLIKFQSFLTSNDLLETILSWKPSKSNPQYYVINIAPTAKSCGRFHKEPIRYESRDLSHHMIFSLMTFSWF